MTSTRFTYTLHPDNRANIENYLARINGDDARRPIHSFDQLAEACACVAPSDVVEGLELLVESAPSGGESRALYYGTACILRYFFGAWHLIAVMRSYSSSAEYDELWPSRDRVKRPKLTVFI